MKTVLRWGLLCMLPCYVLDQWSKWLVRGTLEIGEGIVVIPGYFDIVHVRNTGAAFGLLQGIPVSYRTWFFLIVTLIACGAIGYIFMQSQRSSWLIKIVLALVLTGALGNLTDRLVFREVVDFLNVHIHAYHWPTFNLADVYISVVVISFIVHSVYESRSARGGRPS